MEDDILVGDLLCMALRTRLQPAELRISGNGRSGIDHCAATKPHLAIVDLGLPDMDGRQVIRALHVVSPDTRIIVLTGQVTPSLPAQLLALGVSGYVDKASPLEHAEAAVRRVLEGGIYFSAGATAVPHRTASKQPWPHTEATPEMLSEREREIVRFVASGMVSKEIGARLKLSPRTIEKARARIAEKLQVRDLPSLIKWSVEHGLS